jgi:putative transposase
LPKYKHKTEGRNILVYTVQALSKPAMRDGLIRPSGMPITIESEHTVVDQLRIVPRHGYYVVEVIYSREPVQANVDPSFCVGIDLGVTNLAAIASNREGFVPRLVNGRPLKAWNQWYNKRMKELKKRLPKNDRERVTKQMERITNTRNRRIHHYLHTASKRIVDFLVQEGIGTIIVGKNPLWKQEVKNGRRNNQNFVNIPHARFIDMLTYKAALVGITVEVTEESYTSKASFLDLDEIPVYHSGDEEQHIFSGKRIGRRNRLYRTKDGHKICADVNGAYNILRKRRPDAFNAKGVAGYVVHPVRLAV